jgi:hypothetical protein
MISRHCSTGVLLAGLAALAAAALACNLPSFGQGGCPTRLDQETLDRLTLSMNETAQMQPGGTADFDVGTVECCYFYEPVDTCTVYSVTPTDGASIDPDTGVLTLDADVPSGSVYEVNADVENGRRVVSIEVHVYTDEANPLVGQWHEDSQLACEGGEEIVPEEPILEMVFRADGTFSVTWYPFEVYEDYWGTYTYDPAAGTLTFEVENGNYVPDDLDLSGTFALDEQGQLILGDMWLGTPMDSDAPVGCGHRFSRG